MIGPLDEQFIHQTIDTMDHVATSDFRYTDRLVFYVHENPGDKLLMFGLGAFPNTNTMDGYCLAYRDGIQYNTRFSRPISNDRERMDCGPLHLSILEPLKRWRLVMDENDFGVAFDIEFVARAEAFEHSPIFFRSNKFAAWHQMHYQQSGTYKGWISIGGEKYLVDNWWGSRDRSWGVRGVVAGGQNLSSRSNLTLAWMTAQFPDSTLQNWCFKDFSQNKVLHIDGARTSVETGHGPQYVDWNYEVSKRDSKRSVQVIDNVLTDSEGEVWKLEAEKVLTMYISGITFDDGEFYGKFRGKEIVEGSQWDLTRSDLDWASISSMGTENLVRYRLSNGEVGSGIYETRDLFN